MKLTDKKNKDIQDETHGTVQENKVIRTYN